MALRLAKLAHKYTFKRGGVKLMAAFFVDQIFISVC